MLRQVMKVVKAKARTIVGDESGVTAIEYGLIAAAIAIAIISAVIILDGDITDMFTATPEASGQAEGG